MHFRTRRLTVTNSHLVVQSLDGDGNSLVMHAGEHGEVRAQVRRYDDSEGRPIDGRDIEAIFGIFRLLSGPVLAVVTKSHMVGTGPGKSRFYRVERVDLVPFRRAPKDASLQKDEKYLQQMLKAAFATKCFYFADNYDITLSAQAAEDADASLPQWERADPRFFWNAHLLQPLMAINASEFITPMISGMVKILPSLTASDEEFTLVFISRRNCRRVGTRFNVRGLDSHGNAANFAETEQILLHHKDGRDNGLSSFVQIRGSIPLYWSQYVDMRYTPRVKLGGSEEGSRAAFARHMEQLALYGTTLCVNLIDKKGQQKKLGDAFQAAVEGYNKPNVKYVWFDFHHECRKMQWHNLSKLMAIVEADFDAYGFFAKDSEGRVTRRQTGVIRTNCMDNLDRTNVVQSLFARRFIMTAVGKLGEQRDVLGSPYTSFERSFKNVWADHANAISELYSGTGALKTDFTRTGKRTKAGLLQDGWRSVKRYFIQNVADGRNQDMWDFFMSRYTPDPSDRRALHKARQVPTIAGFLKKLVLFFWVLVALFATFAAPATYSYMSRVRVGVALAFVVFAVLSFLHLKKGVGIGKRIAAKPTLVPRAKSD